MTIEEAIDTLKDIYPSKKEIATGEYPNVAEALDMAVDALRAQQAAGGIVKLPCRAGDKVYVIENVYKKNKVIEKKIAEGWVDRIVIGESGKPLCEICASGMHWYYAMEPGDYYLTREAAEAALEKEGENRE
jgi:hypothetical protein